MDEAPADSFSRVDPTPTETSGPSLRIVLGSVATLTLLFGILSYKRYAESERWVSVGIETLQAAGADLDTDGCIDEVVRWHDRCEEEGANAAVCQQGVKLVMYHCLHAKSRANACETYLEPRLDPGGKVDPGDWVYLECTDRGMPCKQKRECACAEAYRAVDSYCRTGEEAIQL